MKCPVCDDIRMKEVIKHDVLIDICPQCKGVWLDRGELEKLMSQVKEERPAYNEWYDDEKEHDYRKYNHDRRYDEQGSYTHPKAYKKKKKRSVFDIFEELFD